ncbi:DUF1707 SHOCT-like domain-containing protein [Actinomadura hibisca]|uniref:DUF1707 SHOCT-like domain-containing protein n=1 Tax=Actinomadura hibisca TaxID=68565 RepID=UPI0008349470|nr:DUF1707 domain-containing protein [Actinomadura hibisca]
MTRPDDLRVGDIERDAVATALHDHFAAGRLTREELEERLDTALAAKTRTDLREIVRDLPEPHGLPEPPQAPTAQPPRPTWGHHQAWGGHPARRRHHLTHHGHHGRPHGFPVLLAVFLIVGFSAGFGAAVPTVLALAMLIWVVRAVVFATTQRPRRPIR